MVFAINVSLDNTQIHDATAALRAWIRNYTEINVYVVTTHPCPYLNSGVAKRVEIGNNIARKCVINEKKIRIVRSVIAVIPDC